MLFELAKLKFFFVFQFSKHWFVDLRNGVIFHFVLLKMFYVRIILTLPIAIINVAKVLIQVLEVYLLDVELCQKSVKILYR